MTSSAPLRSNPAPSRSRLPSPGSLFVATLLVVVASLGVLLAARVHRQEARIEYIEQIGGQAPILRHWRWTTHRSQITGSSTCAA